MMELLPIEKAKLDYLSIQDTLEDWKPGILKALFEEVLVRMLVIDDWLIIEFSKGLKNNAIRV